MTQRRMVAVLAFLLCLVAGLVLLFEVLHLPSNVTLDWFLSKAVTIILATVVILAAVIIYGRRYVEGGIVGIVVGAVLIFPYQDGVPGVLALLGGVMAVIAEEI